MLFLLVFGKFRILPVPVAVNGQGRTVGKRVPCGAALAVGDGS